MSRFPLILPVIVCLVPLGLAGERAAQATSTALHDAIRKSDSVAVETVLRQNASSVDARDEQGATPLHVAARLDQGAIVEVLLHHGADASARDAKGRAPLSMCLTFGSYRSRAAAALVSHAAEEGFSTGERATLLHRAAWHGDEAVARALVARGIDLRTPNDQGGTLLHSAAAGGLVGLAGQLLAERFEPDGYDRYGMTPLHYAAAYGRAAMCRTLLEAGAPVDAVDRGGRRPLQLARLYGRTEVAALLSARGNTEGEAAIPPAVRGDYFGEPRPGVEPSLFAPGLVSTFEWEHGAPAFSPDGGEAFWTSCLHTRPVGCAVFTARRVGSNWGPAGLAPFASSHGEAYPTFSPDGRTLFFHSRRPTRHGAEPTGGRLWKVTRTRSGWSAPTLAWPSVLADDPIGSGAAVARGGRIYFSMEREDGRGGFDIYVSRLVDGTPSEPEPLPGEVNSACDESMPVVSPDERFLVFNSGDRPENLGAYDLYVSFRRPDGTWGPPAHLPAPVNGPGLNWLASLSPDGRYLFFSSDRNGNVGDVYWVDAQVIESADGAAARQPSATPRLSGPYLGQKPPGDAAELFAEGIVSTSAPEHSAPAFSPEGDLVVWTRVDPQGSPQGRLLEMVRRDGVWGTPAAPSFASGRHDDIYGSFSPDGRTFYFSSRRPLPSGEGARRSGEGMRIWAVSRRDGRWGSPAPLDLTVSPGHEYAHSVSDTGTLYFSSNRPGSRGSLDLYRSRRVNGRYQPAEHLGDAINTERYEDGPFVAPDESYLIFESDRPGSIEGSIDLYICFRQPDGGWSTPLNMGPTVNTALHDRFARVSPDGRFLFFGRSAEGQWDIYWMDAGVIETLRQAAAAQPSPADHATGPYFGLQPPGPVPQVFAPGIVSSPDEGETTPVFSSDGHEIFFTRFKVGERAVIMTARMERGQWTKPAPIWSAAGIFDTKPSLADGGRLLVFASTRPIDGRPEVNTVTRPGCVNLWFAERAGTTWSAPRPFGPAVNTEADEDLPLPGPDRFLYFIRSSPEGYRLFRYPLPPAPGSTAAAEPVEAFVTGVVTSFDPLGRFALYQGTRTDAPGRGVGVVFRQDDGGWEPGKSLGAALDDAGAFAPVASPDGRFVFFMSDRSGNGDVYWVEAPATLARRPRPGGRRARAARLCLTEPSTASMFEMPTHDASRAQL